METRWTPMGWGLLPEARRALSRVILEFDRLRDETAWECAAARAYRDELAQLIGRLEQVRATTDSLEHELRALWQRAFTAVG
ncbi:hypothetical protein ABZ477_15920 [Microbacterium sp. NPDC019599]|uniref:hypothetical protein n=1 Tax=Microbacterium sp. NPDC019599 TaxID=3154690 RepID=UPI0033E211EB